MHAITPLKKLAWIMLCGGCLLPAISLKGEDLLRNGDFSVDLSDWQVPVALQGWTPLQPGGIAAEAGRVDARTAPACRDD